MVSFKVLDLNRIHTGILHWNRIHTALKFNHILDMRIYWEVSEMVLY